VPPISEIASVTPFDTLEFAELPAQGSAVFEVDAAGWQLQVDAHAPGVYRLRCGRPDQLEPKRPRARDQVHADMLLARPEAVGELLVSSVLGSNSGWSLGQGELSFDLAGAPLQFRIMRAGEPVVQTAQGIALGCAEQEDGLCWHFALALTGHEAIHGLGETAGSLDRRGQHLRSDDPDQRFLPLAWSTAGWGLYVNSIGRVDHDVGASDAGVYRIVAYDNPVFDLFLFIGEPSDIVNHYTALTGRSGQPGLRPMGVWLDQAAGQATEDTVALVQDLREKGFALDAVRLAAPAPISFAADKGQVDWDSERISDVREFFARMEALEIQWVAPMMPAVLAGTALFEEWEDRGWLLITDDGDAHVCDGNALSGGKPFGLLDLTHKDVYRLWSERVRQLVEEGLTAVDCVGQFDLPDGITARGGETGAVLRILYPALTRQAMFDAVAGHKTPQEGVVSSRDLYPAVQRSAWQVGPEVSNDWAGMASSLRHALAVGDSGVCLQTHLLGNATAPADALTPELYVRWLAMCVFSGNFHFQGVPALLPTAFDDKTQDLVRHWLQWRYRLIPYVLGIVEDSVRSGLPVQRSMAQAFPQDAVAQVWDSQYMFGPALLVAPILEPGDTTQIYLPEGSAWWDLATGWRYEGGTTWTVKAPLNTLPVFGREGHILSLGPAALHTGDFNTARMLDEVWMFGMPEHSPVVMRNRIRVMQMQGSSYIKGLEGLRILPSEGLEVKRRGAEVRISRAR